MREIKGVPDYAGARSREVEGAKFLDAVGRDREADAVRALIAERDKFRKLAATFLPCWAVIYAERHGAPSASHIVAQHYDQMVECGCRMDDFVRWEP